MTNDGAQKENERGSLLKGDAANGNLVAELTENSIELVTSNSSNDTDPTSTSTLPPRPSAGMPDDGTEGMNRFPLTNHVLRPRKTIDILPCSAWSGLWLGQLWEFWEFRELFAFLIWRDIKVRYKQTVFGVGWAVFQPLMTVIVFTMFFGKFGGIGQRVDGPYSIFVYAALLPWTLFSNSVNQAAFALLYNLQLVSKVYCPRLIIPIAAACKGIVEFMISYVVLLILLLVYRMSVGPAHLLIPVFALGTLIASLGVGIALSALMVAYRDFGQILAFLLQLWMFASPVAYPLNAIPENWRTIYALNPLVGMISGFRSIILDEPWQLACIGVSTATAIISLLLSIIYFRRMEHRFADII